ncbi:MAG: ATP-binding protein [Pseudoxanthomonas suwonensis]|nr:MAG: ATP-binding protein [Pseudoxanthomonas suwonensis]
MARPSRSDEIDAALLRAVGEHPRDLTSMVAAQLGLSRARVNTQVRALVEGGYLRSSGGTRPTYALGPHRKFSRSYPRTGLAEDRVWFADLQPLLADLPRNVLDIAHHGVTEMVNNAVDHSDGRRVDVQMDLDGERLLLAVADDGIGIFRKITRALDLPDERLALLELSKGKLTTDPTRHSGEGIFFTSRAFERFQIQSGGLFFDHDHRHDDDWMYEVETPPTGQGTRVFMEIARDSGRQIGAVFDEYSSGPDAYDFARTVVPVRLAKVDDENLVSRSQAKRLLHRVERFRSVMLDFAEVSGIGQAFADEIFRVFANAHPEVELQAIHAAPAVQQMIRRAEVARGADAGQLPLLR